MRIRIILLLVLATFMFGAVPRGSGDWNLVWNDEFDGNTIDPTHWGFDIGTGPPFPGWGNNELQYYTDRPENARVSNGLLHLVARRESFSGSAYTSARLKTWKRFARQYGRFEFRARLPQGQGYWPALWLLPQASPYGGWAASGEIDVMENRGSDPTRVLGTIHFGGEWPNNAQSHGPAHVLPLGDSVTNFHTYVLEWTTNSIRWAVDDDFFDAQTQWWSTGGPYPAPFDQPFFILMNVAVGGNFGGNPDTSTVFPGEMQIDYVRVYDNTEAFKITMTPEPGQVLLSWPTNILCHLQAQTNSAGITHRWADVLDAPNPFPAPITPENVSVFFRLRSP